MLQSAGAIGSSKKKHHVEGAGSGDFSTVSVTTDIASDNKHRRKTSAGVIFHPKSQHNVRKSVVKPLRSDVKSGAQHSRGACSSGGGIDSIESQDKQNLDFNLSLRQLAQLFVHLLKLHETKLCMQLMEYIGCSQLGPIALPFGADQLCLSVDEFMRVATNQVDSEGLTFLGQLTSANLSGGGNDFISQIGKRNSDSMKNPNQISPLLSASAHGSGRPLAMSAANSRKSVMQSHALEHKLSHHVPVSTLDGPQVATVSSSAHVLPTGAMSHERRHTTLDMNNMSSANYKRAGSTGKKKASFESSCDMISEDNLVEMTEQKIGSNGNVCQPPVPNSRKASVFTAIRQRVSLFGGSNAPRPDPEGVAEKEKKSQTSNQLLPSLEEADEADLHSRTEEKCVQGNLPRGNDAEGASEVLVSAPCSSTGSVPLSRSSKGSLDTPSNSEPLQQKKKS